MAENATVDRALVELTARLDKEWDLPDGSFYKVRNGDLDETQGKDLVNAMSDAARIYRDAHLEGYDIYKYQHIAQLVRLLWYIPIFMSWQEHRIEERGCDRREYVKIATGLHNSIVIFLGEP
jgi:hypothetical protein